MRHLGLLVGALLLTACGGNSAPTPSKPPAKPATFAVTGHMDLDATGTAVIADDGHKGAGCTGQNGFDDIASGAQVVVRDDKGKTVGVSQLEPGAMATGLYAPDAHCTFNFTVPDIDSKADFLSVEVAHRGQVQFKRADAGSVVVTLTG